MKSGRQSSGLDQSILFLCAGDGIGGMERVVMTLAAECSLRSLRTQVVLPNGENAEKTKDWFLSEEGLPVNIHPALKHAYGCRRSKDILPLRSLILRSKASVVNLHYGTSFAPLNDLIAVRSTGKRCIISLHLCNVKNNSLRSSKTKLACLMSNGVVAVSQFQKDSLLSAGVPERKITVVPCGVKMPVISSCVREEARQSFNIPEDAFVVSTAATLDTNKSVGDLLSAMKRCADGHTKTWVLIAGEGQERRQLERQAASQTAAFPFLQYKFVGQLTKRRAMDTLYAASDVFVLPSRSESFGLVFAEAAASAVPCIGYKTAGVPEVVCDGKTGILLPLGDTNAMAMAIARLRDTANLRHHMSAYGRDYAERHFTVERMTDAYMDLFFPTDRS